METKMRTFKLTPGTLDQLAVIADAWGTSPSGVVERLVSEYAAWEKKNGKVV
jgi:hypothetical protein